MGFEGGVEVELWLGHFSGLESAGLWSGRFQGLECEPARADFYVLIKQSVSLISAFLIVFVAAYGEILGLGICISVSREVL